MWMSERDAIEHLHKRGYVLGIFHNWVKTRAGAPTQKDELALSYLMFEWGYGGVSVQIRKGKSDD